MPTDEIELVSFMPEHIDGALALSHQAEWPHRAEDWRLALALSRGIVALDDAGRVVGTILMTPYGDDCATINMVIVDEAMRGRGLGRKLMDQAMALAGNRPLRLIATRDGLPLYRKLGFVDRSEIVQHQGPVMPLDSPGAVEPATAHDLPGIKALDLRAFGADRTTLIDALFHQAQFAVIRHGGRIEAYAALRAFGRGHVIGPAVASTAKDAKSLITALAARLPGAFVRVDTAVTSGLADWLTEIGLFHVGGGIVMHRPAALSAAEDSPRIFALANQALG